MKPFLAYKSLREKKLYLKILLPLLFIQLFLILSKEIYIPLPSSLCNIIAKQLNEHANFIAKVDGAFIRLDGNIHINDLTISDRKVDILSIENCHVNFNMLDFFINSANLINDFYLDNLKIYAEENNQKYVEVSSLSGVSNNKEEIILNFKSNFRNFTINGKGLFSLASLKSKKQSSSNFDQIVIMVRSAISKISILSESTNSFHTDLFFSYASGVKIRALIKSNNQNKRFYTYNFSKCSISAEFNDDLDSGNLLARIFDSRIEIENQTIIFPEISLNSYFENQNNHNIIHSEVSVNPLKLRGELTGNFPKFTLFNRLRQNVSDTVFISDSDTITAYIKLKNEHHQKEITGHGNVNPDLTNITHSNDYKELSLISGTRINFRIKPNLAPTNNNFLSSFKIEAENVSVMESPFGKYELNGELKDDLSVEIRKAVGQMGRSIVSGSYSQLWNPNAYQFRLEGKCYPPDINNWLKDWWDKIWYDFKFSQDIPFGNFEISGIWGGEIGNSKTFGMIESKAISYRGFHIKNSRVKVKVDENATIVSSSHIKHSKGDLSGKLSFPRSHTKSPVSLKFEFDGNFPLNQCRKTFGPNFEDAVSEINASTVISSANGVIYRSDSDLKDKNKLYFKFRSNEPIEYKGITITGIEGEIKKQGNITKGHLPKFSIAGGIGQLNFEHNTSETSQTILINFTLKDSSLTGLVKQFSKSSVKGLFNKNNSGIPLNNINQGRVSIALQAKGPNDLPLQFEGTGRMVINEYKLGQINLLGNISKGLTNLNIPLPSGALSFSELILPFELNNESVFFNSLILNGPLSKITAEGSLNLVTGNVDVIAKLNLIGNLPLPIIKNIVEFADPLSRMTEIKLTGDYKNPKWKVLLSSE